MVWKAQIGRDGRNFRYTTIALAHWKIALTQVNYLENRFRSFDGEMRSAFCSRFDSIFDKKKHVCAQCLGKEKKNEIDGAPYRNNASQCWLTMRESKIFQ